ncbi:uncharacterized protein ACN2A1_003017 [Glossina fuscipes fuscipes]
MKFFIILTFSLSVILFQVAHSITLHDIDVPHMVVIGDDDESDDVINLDCEYELEDNPTYLVVKWFMNNNAIYQWIRGQKPSVVPWFRDHVGEIVETSTEPNHQYRGLTLINPSIELDGVYKCLVQTENDSKFKEEELNIVDVSNFTIHFDHVQVQNETHLECSVHNIYPEPIISFDPDDEVLIHTTPINVTKLDNGYYDAIAGAVVQNIDEDEDKFVCSIKFDGLPYNINVDVVSSADALISFESFSLLLISSLARIMF